MSQSTLSAIHVAIIMDGNGRWALGQGKPRISGHREGARTVRRVVEHAARRGIGHLTLYAFSSDNWARPRAEVDALMRLFRRYLEREAPRCRQQGIRLRLIGRRDRLAPALLAQMEWTERYTARGKGLRLRIALDYSARDALARCRPARLPATEGEWRSALAEVLHETEPIPDVDLLIRTGGERRLSDFLLWESAYAEMWFTNAMWPDFGPAQFDRALQDFSGRDRRFGGLTGSIAG